MKGINGMFKDKRSGRVAIVAHCILNQNSRVPGLAERSSIITEIVEFLENNDIGIIQMPCPELAYAGVSRRGQTKELYDNPVFRRNCKKIAEEIVDQIQEYSRCQIKTELIIGVEGSPSCGVTDNLKADSLRNSSKHKKREDTGILIEELRSVLEERNISMPIIGIGYEALPQDLAEMKRLLQD